MTDAANVVLPSIHQVHFSTHSYQEGYVKHLNVSDEVHDFYIKRDKVKTCRLKKFLLSNNEHKRQLMSLLKLKLYYNTNTNTNLELDIYRII